MLTHATSRVPLADEIHLPGDIAITADTGDLAVFFDRRKHLVERGEVFRCPVCAGDAHSGEQIAGANMDNIHARHRGNGIDVGEGPQPSDVRPGGIWNGPPRASPRRPC